GAHSGHGDLCTRSEILESVASHCPVSLYPGRRLAAILLQSATSHCLAESRPKSAAELPGNHKISRGWLHGQPSAKASHPPLLAPGPIRLLVRRECKSMTIQPLQIANDTCR